MKISGGGVMEGNCEKCGAHRKSLHKHHWKLQSEGGTDADGISWLCANCHEDEHGGPCGGGGNHRLSQTPTANLKRSISCTLLWGDVDHRRRVLEGQAKARTDGKRDDKAIGRKVAAAWTPERRAAHADVLRKVREVALDGRWAIEFDACLICGRTDRPHQANGLCRTCYSRQYMRDRHKKNKSSEGAIETNLRAPTNKLAAMDPGNPSDSSMGERGARRESEREHD